MADCNFDLSLFFSVRIQHDRIERHATRRRVQAVGRLDDDIHLSTFLKEFATALTPTGAFFGCLAGSAPADKYGRRLSVLFTSVSIFSLNILRFLEQLKQLEQLPGTLRDWNSGLRSTIHQ